jgi:hypothetical protein
MGAYICDLELELEVAFFEFKIMWCSGSLDWIAEPTYTGNDVVERPRVLQRYSLTIGQVVPKPIQMRFVRARSLISSILMSILNDSGI